LMSSLMKAMELGAGLASNGGGGGEVAEGGGDMVDKIAKLAQVFGPFLGALLTPKPQMTTVPQIQPTPRPTPQPAPTRPQPRDVRPARPQPASASVAPKPTPQPAPQPAPQPQVDIAQASSEIDQLVELILNSPPEDAAAELRTKVDPGFLQIAKNPEAVIQLVGKFKPELINDLAFGVRVRQVCAALNK
jgi:hypothetical protein